MEANQWEEALKNKLFSFKYLKSFYFLSSFKFLQASTYLEPGAGKRRIFVICQLYKHFPNEIIWKPICWSSNPTVVAQSITDRFRSNGTFLTVMICCLLFLPFIVYTYSLFTFLLRLIFLYCLESSFHDKLFLRLIVIRSNTFIFSRC